MRNPFTAGKQTFRNIGSPLQPNRLRISVFSGARNATRIKSRLANLIAGIFLFLGVPAGVQAAGDWGALTDGTIHVMLSSHQDLGWENSIPWCNDRRSEKIIKPVLTWMGQTDSDYRYTFEYVYALMHYLDTYPDALETVREYTSSGRFQWGAAYIDFYESLYSSEAVVRQFYLQQHEGCIFL